MASEKQIAANRANAQKSTGPKTAAGRLKSSRERLSPWAVAALASGHCGLSQSQRHRARIGK